jgi:hypothetical protein
MVQHSQEVSADTCPVLTRDLSCLTDLCGRLSS